jgi:hypothetical protein
MTSRLFIVDAAWPEVANDQGQSTEAGVNKPYCFHLNVIALEHDHGTDRDGSGGSLKAEPANVREMALISSVALLKILDRLQTGHKADATLRHVHRR